MRNFLILAMFGGGFLSLRADEFDVGTVIHPVVMELGVPKMLEGFGEGQMAITTRSDEAARHFAQGLTKLNTSWDFEAYRHFCETVKLDPECLMGYWGISLCLSSGQHEFFGERKAAIERMLDLLEAEKEEGKDRWNVMETGFVQGAGYLLTDGREAAARSFTALANKFPANIEARLLSLFLQRDGFDRLGRPRFGQENAIKGLTELVEANPENLSVLAFWVNTMAETPGEVAMLREKVLPVAKKLVERHPGYAPFHLILTHVEARCGNADAGIAAGRRARDLYEEYRTKEEVTLYDCDGLLRTELYLASLHQMKGDLKEGLAVAKKLAEIRVEEERVFSKGAMTLMWEGWTLAARMVASGDRKEEFDQGKVIMEAIKEEDWFKEKSFAIYYRDCLGFYLGVRSAIAEGEVELGKRLFDQFLLRVEGMEKTRAQISKTAFFTPWLRAMGTLAMLVPELRGLLAEQEAGASRAAAATWYLAARDRQERPANLLPPSIGYPMQLRLGNHFVLLKDDKQAAEWFQQGLEFRPNHLELLSGLQAVMARVGETEKAAALKKELEALRK